MPLTSEPDAVLLTAYRAALDRVPTLTRVVFLLHRIDDLAFDDIARRLSIEVVAVRCFVAEALLMVRAMLDGEEAHRKGDAAIALAETALRERYRGYCEEHMRARGLVGTIEWEISCSDDTETVMRLLLVTMAPAARETFVLHRVSGQSYAEIANMTGAFQWMVRRRMLAAIRHIALGPCSFENWLRMRCQ